MAPSLEQSPVETSSVGSPFNESHVAKGQLDEHMIKLSFTDNQRCLEKAICQIISDSINGNNGHIQMNEKPFFGIGKTDRDIEFLDIKMSIVYSLLLRKKFPH